MRRKEKERGFTLIELLVVIAIIGVLASMVMTSLSKAKAKARDARRVEDIRQIQNALEMYYAEHGRYPGSYWSCSGEGEHCGRHHFYWWQLEQALGQKLPVDPINEDKFPTEGGYSYEYLAGGSATMCYGQAYMIIYNKETEDEYEGKKMFCRSDGRDIYDFGGAFVVGMKGSGELELAH